MGLSLGACFIEPSEPPAFRAACDAASDCADGDSCIDGLCQRECTLATFEEDCEGGNYLLCLNGVCTSLCDPSADSACPDPQSCLGFELPPETAQSFGASSLNVCGISCDDATRPCAEGELCFEGICIDPSSSTTGTDAGTDGTGETGTP